MSLEGHGTKKVLSIKKIKERLFSGSKWAFFAKVLTSLITVLANALLSRLLTPEEFGTYFLTLSIVTFCTILGTLGMKQSIVRLVAENMAVKSFNRVRKSIKLTLVVGFVGAFCIAGIYYFSNNFWANQLFDSPLLGAIGGVVAGWIIVMSIQRLIAEVHRGFHDIKMASMFGGVSALGLVASAIFLAALTLIWLSEGESSLSEVIIWAVISGIGMTILSSSFLFKRIKKLPTKDAVENSETLHLNELLGLSWPLLINGITSFFFSNGDIWILSSVASQDIVAIYGAVLRLIGLVTMPLLIINAVVPPMISEMYTNGQLKALEKVLRALATLIGIPSFIFFIGIILFNEEILNIIYGEYYIQGSWIMIILCVGQLLNVWAGSCGLVLVYTNYEKVMLVISLVTCSIVLLGGFFAAKYFGAIGLAVLMASTMTLSNISKVIAVKYLTGMWTHINFFSNPIKDLKI